MKIFVSWSGELSCKIAEVLKKWIPCIIQSIDIFFSSEDIEKGNNWDKTISEELSQCKYGIICLTSDNISAPWINFEAGAIARTLDSKVSTLMINVKPSDIKGPLSRYQATKLEKDDFYQLISSINRVVEKPLEESVLMNTFNGMWEYLQKEVNFIISEFESKSDGKRKNNTSKQAENGAIEEILQILRKQNSLLSSPEELLPIEYMQRIKNIFLENDEIRDSNDTMLVNEIIQYLQKVMPIWREYFRIHEELAHVLELRELLYIFKLYARIKNSRKLHLNVVDLEKILLK